MSRPVTARAALSIGGSDEEASCGAARQAERSIADCWPGTRQVPDDMRRAITIAGLAPENGMFRLGLILGGSWCLRRQTGVTVETASTIEPGSAGSRRCSYRPRPSLHCFALIGDSKIRSG
jgi:hypothetical protein